MCMWFQVYLEKLNQLYTNHCVPFGKQKSILYENYGFAGLCEQSAQSNLRNSYQSLNLKWNSFVHCSVNKKQSNNYCWQDTSKEYFLLTVHAIHHYKFTYLTSFPECHNAAYWLTYSYVRLVGRRVAPIKDHPAPPSSVWALAHNQIHNEVSGEFPVTSD